MNDQLIARTTDIVTAFVTNNTLPASELPGLIASVHSSLSGMDMVTITVPDIEPAVPVRKSVQPDHVVCLVCGTKHKMLKRHLMAAHSLTDQEYRAKFKLPADHPLTAPNYSARRKDLAIKHGLGRKREG